MRASRSGTNLMQVIDGTRVHVDPTMQKSDESNPATDDYKPLHSWWLSLAMYAV